MKSSYELAMERLKASDPNSVTTLTEKQKEKLAEIDQRYKAKIAEKEIFLQTQLQETLVSGRQEDAEQIEQQLRNEKARLKEEMEDAREKVRRKSK